MAASYRVYEGLTYAPAILSGGCSLRDCHICSCTIGEPTERCSFEWLAVVGRTWGWSSAAPRCGWAHPIVVTLFGNAYAPGQRAALQVLAGGFAICVRHLGFFMRRQSRAISTGGLLVDHLCRPRVECRPQRAAYFRRGASRERRGPRSLAEALTAGCLFVQVWRRVNQP